MFSLATLRVLKGIIGMILLSFAHSSRADDLWASTNLVALFTFNSASNRVSENPGIFRDELSGSFEYVANGGSNELNHVAFGKRFLTDTNLHYGFIRPSIPVARDRSFTLLFTYWFPNYIDSQNFNGTNNLMQIVVTNASERWARCKIDQVLTPTFAGGYYKQTLYFRVNNFSEQDLYAYTTRDRLTRFAVVSRRNSFELYINGVRVAKEFGDALARAWSSAEIFNGDPNAPCYGDLDNIMIFNRDLTDDEISQQMIPRQAQIESLGFTTRGLPMLYLPGANFWEDIVLQKSTNLQNWFDLRSILYTQRNSQGFYPVEDLYFMDSAPGGGYLLIDGTYVPELAAKTNYQQMFYRALIK